MKKGEIVKARTHAELLNELFGTNYKQWYKCTYDIKKDNNSYKKGNEPELPTIFVWMVCLNNTKNAGRRNKFEDDTTIIEQFDKPMTCSEERFNHGLNIKQRLVFEKINTSNGRIYKFHGVYELADTPNDKHTRTLKLIDDEYDFTVNYGNRNN